MQPSIPLRTSANDWILGKFLSRRIHPHRNSSPGSKIGLHRGTIICFFYPKPGGFSERVNTQPYRPFPGRQGQVIWRKTFLLSKIKLRKNRMSESKIGLHRRTIICFFCPNPGRFPDRVNTRPYRPFPGRQGHPNKNLVGIWKISVGGIWPCWTP